VDTTAFGRCISLFSEQIKTKKKFAVEKCAQLLVSQVSEHFSGVSDIPRQYRWTKRSAPTGFSPYLISAFSLCEKFAEEAGQIGWSVDEIDTLLKLILQESIAYFCERAEKVINTVEQTGFSLQRFKQRKTGSEDQQQQKQQAPSDSDEAKIRFQLIFDVNFVRQRCTEKGIVLECLTRLENTMQGLN